MIVHLLQSHCYRYKKVQESQQKTGCGKNWQLFDKLHEILQHDPAIHRRCTLSRTAGRCHGINWNTLEIIIADNALSIEEVRPSQQTQNMQSKTT